MFPFTALKVCFSALDSKVYGVLSAKKSPFQVNLMPMIECEPPAAFLASNLSDDECVPVIDTFTRITHKFTLPLERYVFEHDIGNVAIDNVSVVPHIMYGLGQTATTTHEFVTLEDYVVMCKPQKLKFPDSESEEEEETEETLTNEEQLLEDSFLFSNAYVAVLPESLV